MKSDLIVLLVGVLGAPSPALAEQTETSVEVVVQPDPPRIPGKPLGSPKPKIPLGISDQPPTLDGRLDEPLWLDAEPGPPPESLVNLPPPDPRWGLTAVATPGGLAIALRGVPLRSETRVSVDPNASRIGWAELDLSADPPTIRRCRARDLDAVPPFAAPARVYVRPCGAAVPAQASHGPDGWELLVPWSALDPSTDDLQIQWYTKTPEASATYDVGRAARTFAGAGRSVQIEGQRGRSESVGVSWDRARGVATWTVRAAGLKGPEDWDWQVHYNGQWIHAGRLTLEPNPSGAALATLETPNQPHTGTGILVAQSGGAPLVRGAWHLPWGLTERATVATPVHAGRVELRYTQQGVRERTLRFRGPDGALLLERAVELSSGKGSVLVAIPESWPDHLEVELEGLFPEGSVPVKRQEAP
ncbi:MAG: hypothetical protein EA397_18780 [Deltaproteobacteria bacterium]|nr:MAG: hypothetical protein EA397_18780 [Deltaproteobacteria bacterium]